MSQNPLHILAGRLFQAPDGDNASQQRETFPWETIFGATTPPETIPLRKSSVGPSPERLSFNSRPLGPPPPLTRTHRHTAPPFLPPKSPVRGARGCSS